jgi:SMI1 / KNR4 family (SUKH-1)
MSNNPPPKLQPYAGCQWNSISVDNGFYWELGGSAHHKDGFGPSYVVIAPEHIPVTTIGLRSETCRKGFDYLYLRIGALEACNLPIEAGQTTFIFVEKQEGWKSRSLISLWKQPFANEILSRMIQLMNEESNPASVPEIKAYFTTHQNRNLKALIPLKPYQQHRIVHQGLKLGEFLSDHVDAEPALFAKLEKRTKSQLPADYRSFMMETNGGHLKNQVFFHAKGMGKPRRLASFLRFDDKSEFSLPRSHFQFDPPGFLCIARDGNEKYIYLGIDEAIHGRVYWVAPKAYEEGFEDRTLTASQRASLAGVHLLADSFSAFIRQLEVTDELA